MNPFDYKIWGIMQQSVFGDAHVLFDAENYYEHRKNVTSQYNMRQLYIK